MPNKSLALAEYKGNKRAALSFSEFPVFNAFSTTSVGEESGIMLNSWVKASGDEGVANKNVAAFFALVGISDKNRVHMIPGAGNRIKVITEKNIANIIAGGGMVVCDGLITTMVDIPLTVCPADCLPVILGSADSKHRFCCLLHISRKSWKAGIIQGGVEAVHMVQDGIPNSQIVAAIGPGVGLCCCNKLNLRQEVHKQLLEYGLAKDNIWEDRVICTCCSKFSGSQDYVFPSHRRAGEKGHERRFMALTCLQHIKSFKFDEFFDLD